MIDGERRREALAGWRRRLTWQVPFDRDAAERAIGDAYRVAGARPPDTILWATGPRDAQAILSRTGWRRWWPWLLVVAAFAVPGLLTLVPTRAVAAGSLMAGLPVIALVLCLSALWAHTILLLGAPSPRPGIDWRLRIFPIAALAVALAALAIHNTGAGLPLSLFLGGFIAMPGVVALAMRPPAPKVSPPTRTGGSLGGKMSRAFHRSLNEASGRSRNWFPLGEAGERLPDYIRLMAMAAPPSFVTPVVYYALDRLLRTWVAEEPERHSPRLAAFAELVRRVDCVWAFERVAIALEPPAEVHLDERGRFHRMDGPAVWWRDGSSLFAVEGRFANDPSILFAPESLSLLQIRDEPDPGVRRALLAQYGPERLMERQGRMVSSDSYGELWRVDQFDGEPLAMVKVVNSTPEPDGSRKIYWLRVPPNTRNPREGVAWTFGLSPGTYAPSVQT